MKVIKELKLPENQILAQDLDNYYIIIGISIAYGIVILTETQYISGRYEWVILKDIGRNNAVGGSFSSIKKALSLDNLNEIHAFKTTKELGEFLAKY